MVMPNILAVILTSNISLGPLLIPAFMLGSMFMEISLDDSLPLLHRLPGLLLRRLLLLTL